MTEQISNPYDAVLADLRLKRAEIDSAIELLARLRGGASEPGFAGQAPAPDAPPDGGVFLSMSIADAAFKLLSLRKRKMTNAEIMKALTEGGMVLSSKDPLNVVNSVLTRRFNSAGDIVRVDRGTWGLKAWYPGRNFQKAKADAPEPKTDDGDDPEIDLKVDRWREEQADIEHAAKHAEQAAKLTTTHHRLDLDDEIPF